MADHWRTPHTDDDRITGFVMAVIVTGCICWFIGFAMGMVVS